MGGFLGDVGKTISKAFKDVGKTVKKAAPILIPLAITAATGGLGGGSMFAGLGSIGSKLASGVLGGLVSSKTGGGAIGPDDVAVEPEGNILQNLFKTMAPTLITRAIEGKPKSAQEEAAAIYKNMPGNSPATQQAAADFSKLLGSNIANPTKLALGSPASRMPMTYGNELAASSAPRDIGGTPASPVQPDSRINFTSPMAPVAPAGIMTGGTVGAPSAPIAFTSGMRPEEMAAARKARGFAIRGRAA